MSKSQTIARRGEDRQVAFRPDEVAGLSIGEYLIRRLRDYGIDDVFGIPGDYVLAFFSLLNRRTTEGVGSSGGLRVATSYPISGSGPRMRA